MGVAAGWMVAAALVRLGGVAHGFPLGASGGTLGGMYPLVAAGIPASGVVEVPCYAAASFNGRTAVLRPEVRRVPLDFASLSERDVELMVSVRAEEWVLRGLVAVDVDWLVGVLEVVSSGPQPRPLGVEVDDVWFFVAPLHSVPTVVGGRYVAVGLYR